MESDSVEHLDCAPGFCVLRARTVRVRGGHRDVFRVIASNDKRKV